MDICNNMKKNTLLYLDEDLVRLAKKLNINISRLAEEALKEKLLSLLPKSEKKLLEKSIMTHFFDHLHHLREEGYCYFLRIPIKEVKIKNIWKIDSLILSFTKGLNIIYDPEEKAKNIVINGILETLGRSKPVGLSEESKALGEIFGKMDDLFFHPDLKRGEFLRLLQVGRWKRDGEIRLKFFDGEIVVNYSSGERETRVKSILLDEPVLTFNKRLKEKFIKWLRKNYKCQIIIGTKDKDLVKFAENLIDFRKIEHR